VTAFGRGLPAVMGPALLPFAAHPYFQRPLSVKTADRGSRPKAAGQRERSERPLDADCGRCPLMGSEIDYLPHWTSMRCQRQSAIVMSEDLGAQHLAVGLRNKARPQLPPMQIRLIICALGNIPVSAVCFRIQFPKCT
jgi:hypothetical protein